MTKQLISIKLRTIDSPLKYIIERAASFLQNYKGKYNI